MIEIISSIYVIITNHKSFFFHLSELEHNEQHRQVSDAWGYEWQQILQTHFFVTKNAESLIKLFIFGKGVGSIKNVKNGIKMSYSHSFKRH